VLTHDARQGLLLLRSEQAAGFFGVPAKGQRLEAGVAQLQLASSTRGFVAALLTSLDGKPLRQSGHWLFSLPGDLVGSQPGAMPRRPKSMVNYERKDGWWTLEPDPNKPSKPSGSREALGPLWMEMVESRLTLQTPARSLTVYPLNGSGQRQVPLSPDLVRPVAGGFEIALHVDRQKLSPWYEIVAEGLPAANSVEKNRGN